jgi:hypothetical protein
MPLLPSRPLARTADTGASGARGPSPKSRVAVLSKTLDGVLDMNSFDDVRRSGGSFQVVFSKRGAAAFTLVGLVAMAACSSSSKTSASSGSMSLQCQMPGSESEIANAAALFDSGGALVGVDGGAVTCSMPGNGVTTGPMDTHCEDEDGGEMRQVTDQPACCGQTDASEGDGGGTETCAADGGVVGGGVDNGTCCSNAYNPTMWGQQGSDDDCKYDVSWTATPICVGANVYFTVHATKRANATTFQGGLPLTDAYPYIEAVLNCSAVASATQPDPVEFMPGWYQVGPSNFPVPGVWSVRFHFNENCIDELPDSPHGHAAFWITVPPVSGGGSAPDASADASGDASPGATSGGASDAASDALEQ